MTPEQLKEQLMRDKEWTHLQSPHPPAPAPAPHECPWILREFEKISELLARMHPHWKVAEIIRITLELVRLNHLPPVENYIDEVNITNDGTCGGGIHLHGEIKNVQ